jgi:transposase
VYQVHDWAEVHRLFEREGLSKSAIARRLGMSRPTVIRLLGLQEPPRYQREPAGSKLDAYKHAIAAMLDGDP